jgi:hypothetical protein
VIYIRRPFAQALDVNAVGYFKHMRHVVTDQTHGQAFVAQRCGGLVHDDHVLCKRCSASHGHALALSA